ncbi:MULTISPECIES: bifunctional riboflavin kinase/FAD synthetase [unclassified Cyanobium]|uniref:bifunctional riboflavin kinase/FAD synthetase n=1 Tax=unclassified Cyanobium TaxID=2627006 RepID=UPI0020CBAE74|nr:MULTISPECIES: bifunctional riboflavin kinase/FAD synthetase [unclassified Cyanobium]MCP9833701.1 bifunctional riboflavin kinase/FAD synthetase [Cyanobium sp. La Preciosa 7G6]MCP9936541.1 bifunctional riboflavin kinase/FAD synthetase [Cyanobium sp. Aljojuca 7A6]
MIPLHDPSHALRPTAIALGSFDGLHRGHRRVITAVTEAQPAAQEPVVPTVVSFWPHPREVLHGETRLRLDLPEEKLELLEPLGIEQLVLVPFSRELAALTPERFVQEVLAERLQARQIAVGTNFRFGVDRSGDVDDLARIGAALGIDVRVLPMLWDGAERVSSSRIRRALAAGDIEEAGRLLERPYRFSGAVVGGRGLGRQLGWPTANLAVDGRKFLPLEGVYAALAWRDGEDGAMAAVMNLGPQPTVDPLAPSTVEVHLLERNLELAGSRLTVQPLKLLRRQQAFASLEALSRQIRLDADLALQDCQACRDALTG